MMSTPMTLTTPTGCRHDLSVSTESTTERLRMKLWRWTSVLLVALATLASASTQAFAQASGATQSVGTQEDELEAFWAQRRGVRVVQRRLYETDGDIQLTLGFGAIPNDPFLNYYPISLRAAYWASNQLAIELSGSFVGLRGSSDLSDFLEARGGVDSFLRDEQLWRANIAALYSPIYGKFSLAGRKLAHFDWFFGGGLGVVSTQSPEEADLTVVNSSIKPEVALVTGWNLHFSQRFALRLDYRQYIFQKDSGGVTLPSELGIGASVFF
jgi:outer membrane beta-barrel protein